MSDAVVCGLNRNEICLLGFLNEAWCQRLVGEALPLAELSRHPKVIDAVKAGLQKHNAANPKPSARIARILLQETPPQADAGEITEKGYMNQGRTLDLRKDQVEMLYASSVFDAVVAIGV